MKSTLMNNLNVKWTHVIKSIIQLSKQQMHPVLDLVLIFLQLAISYARYQQNLNNSSAYNTYCHKVCIIINTLKKTSTHLTCIPFNDVKQLYLFILVLCSCNITKPLYNLKLLYISEDALSQSQNG